MLSAPLTEDSNVQEQEIEESKTLVVTVEDEPFPNVPNRPFEKTASQEKRRKIQRLRELEDEVYLFLRDCLEKGKGVSQIELLNNFATAEISSRHIQKAVRAAINKLDKIFSEDDINSVLESVTTFEAADNRLSEQIASILWLVGFCTGLHRFYFSRKKCFSNHIFMGLVLLCGFWGFVFAHAKCNYLYDCANPESANDDFPMCWSQQSQQYHIVWFLQFICLFLALFIWVLDGHFLHYFLLTANGEKVHKRKDIQTAFILWLPLGWICASHRLYLTRKPFSSDSLFSGLVFLLFFVITLFTYAHHHESGSHKEKNLYLRGIMLCVAIDVLILIHDAWNMQYFVEKANSNYLADPDVFSSLKPRWKIHGEIRNESSSAVKVTSKRSAKRRLFPPRTIHIAQTTFPVGDISKTEMGNGQSFFNQLSED